MSLAMLMLYCIIVGNCCCVLVMCLDGLLPCARTADVAVMLEICAAVMLPYLQVMLQMCPECDVSKIPKSGPAPVLLRPHELAMIGPDWETYTAWIEGNANAKQVLGKVINPPTHKETGVLGLCDRHYA